MLTLQEKILLLLQPQGLNPLPFNHQSVSLPLSYTLAKSNTLHSDSTSWTKGTEGADLSQKCSAG